MSKDTRESTLTWHRITGADGQLPDASSTVLVYDADLEDVAQASLEWDIADEMFWLDAATDQRLPNPTWWADVPFPEED